MSETTPASSSGMRLEAARERISTFSEFGPAHHYFAQHAAFPMSLTVDLLYRLWANFQRDIHDEQLHIPWIAVADLLLSSLCDEVGHELYEMDVTVRVELLRDLQADPRFGQQRIHELSYFLLDYVQQQVHSSNAAVRTFAEAQQWTVLAYIQPGRVARELAEALKALEQNNRVEQIRLVSVMETLNKLAPPLSALEGFTPLLTYARGVERVARGDIEGAKAQFGAVKVVEQIEQAVGVQLPRYEGLHEVRQEIAQPEQAPIAPATPATPDATGTQKDFLISYYSADIDWANWITWQLEEAGYTIELQAWAFQPGANFVEEVDRVEKLAKHIMVLLSPDYLSALASMPAWVDAFFRDPRNSPDFMVALHVRECKATLTSILGTIDYTDLVGLDEEAVGQALMSRLSRLPDAPSLPSGMSYHSLTVQPQFPGTPLPVSKMDKCPFCGSETRPGDNFCLNCGNRLVPASSSPQQVQPTFGDATLPAQEDWAAAQGTIQASPMPSWANSSEPTIANTDVEPATMRSDNVPTIGQTTIDRVENPARFILHAENGSVVKEFPLDKLEMSIGRAPSSDILLSKDKLTSRRHATVHYENDRYLLRDEHSANGTFVNGQQLEEAGTVVLNDGDHIGIGEHELIFRAFDSTATGVEDLSTIAVPYDVGEMTYQTREDELAMASSIDDDYHSPAETEAVVEEVTEGAEDVVEETGEGVEDISTAFEGVRQAAEQSINRSAAETEASQKTKEQWKEEGDTLTNAGRYTEALEAYDRAIALDPNYALAYHRKGNTLRIHLKRYDEALEAYDRAIALDPNYAPSYNHKGHTLHDLGRYEEALVCYAQAIRLDSRYWGAYTNRGSTLYVLQRYDEALKACNRAIAINPYFGYSYDIKGKILEKLQRYDEALEAYEQAISLDPGILSSQEGKNNVLKLLGRSTET